MTVSNHKRLNFLIRKNKGIPKLSQYKNFFLNLHLEDLHYIELEECDEIIDRITNIFPFIAPDNEMIQGTSAVKDSKLLGELYESSNKNDACYIFIDDVEECGMFKANTRSALDTCLLATKLSYENTFFLTDIEFRFSVRINYYSENDPYDKNTFDIQRQLREKTWKDIL